MGQIIKTAGEGHRKDCSRRKKMNLEIEEGKDETRRNCSKTRRRRGSKEIFV